MLNFDYFELKLFIGTQEEAAEAYDIAAIKFRGVNAVTNFDISRYDVERIMASNTLPTGELARRNKDREQPINESIEYGSSSAQNADQEIVQTAKNVIVSDWKMALYHQQQQNEPHVESLRNYSCSSFSTSLHDLVGIGIDSGNSTHQQQSILDESAKIGAHFSNSSSLVTSLNNSREASPDRNGTSVTKFISSPLPTTNLTSWIPSAQLKPVPISMAHLPVFAAWGGDI